MPSPCQTRHYDVLNIKFLAAVADVLRSVGPERTTSGLGHLQDFTKQLAVVCCKRVTNVKRLKLITYFFERSNAGLAFHVYYSLKSYFICFNFAKKV